MGLTANVVATTSSGGVAIADPTTAPYQVGDQITVDNTSSANDVICYTVPAGKKFIGMIQRNSYFNWKVNDQQVPGYINGLYAASSAFYSIPNTKIHLVAGSVVKKEGANSAHLRLIGVESDA